MREGKDEKSVTLNEENNRRYEWTGLSGNVNWTVTEKKRSRKLHGKYNERGHNLCGKKYIQKPEGPSDNDTDHEETTSETGTETVTKPNNTPSGVGGRRKR